MKSWRTKKKLNKPVNISIPTRITDQKIPCVYIDVYWIIKNWGPGPYRCYADNRRCFLGLSLTWNRGEAHMFYLTREVGKFGHPLAEKKVTLSWLTNSNMVKPKKYGHLHLFYHFTIPLNLRYSRNTKFTDQVYN